jgi:hypothetical protein
MSGRRRELGLTSKIDVPVDPELRDWLQQQAERKRLPVASFVRLLLSEAMEADQSRRKEDPV